MKYGNRSAGDVRLGEAATIIQGGATFEGYS
jgi:hypothetical protein